MCLVGAGAVDHVGRLESGLFINVTRGFLNEGLVRMARLMRSTYARVAAVCRTF